MGSILFLLGYFLFFCAAIMLTAAGWREYREHMVNSRWVETPAQVQKCSLDIYHPFRRDGGGVVYSLRCRLRVEAAGRPYDYALRTTSEPSEASRERMEEWVAQNKPGTMLLTRVNPSDPNELRVVSVLPVRQTETAKDGLVTALAFGALGLLFVAIARQLGIPVRPVKVPGFL